MASAESGTCAAFSRFWSVTRESRLTERAAPEKTSHHKSYRSRYSSRRHSIRDSRPGKLFYNIRDVRRSKLGDTVSWEIPKAA